MNLQELVRQLLIDTTGNAGPAAGSIAADSSVGLFLPELVLCATILMMLLVRAVAGVRRGDVAWVALAGAGLALYLAWVHSPTVPQRVEFFTGLVVYDSFTVGMRCLLLLFLVLFVLFTRLTGIPHRDDAQDVYSLVFGSTLGMCLMAEANHLMIIFLAVEMASVPSYALAGLMKGRKVASEAALKYAVYGAGTAGVMLYGISLIAGLTNSAHLPTIVRVLVQQGPTMSGDALMVLALGGLLLMVGLAFKLSAVPFHFWCPDVFEGATAEVDAFLSVSSKAAALALLVRVTLGLSVAVGPGASAGHTGIATGVRVPPPSVTLSAAAQAGEGPAVGRAQPADPRTAVPITVAVQAGSPPGVVTASPLRTFLAKLVALLAIVTCSFGNLAAYGQTNIKRLLAYSTIAHAGYMMMAVPAALAVAASDGTAAREGVAALFLYLAVYLFLNLGAFAVVAFLRNAMRSESITDYAGLIRHCPGVVVCFSLMLFGLIGLPPLSGFLGKFAVFAALVRSWWATADGYLLALLVVGGVNTAVSLFYYLRLVKIMTMDPDPATRGPVALPLVSLPGVFLVLVTVPTAVLITCWDFLNKFAWEAARQLL